MRRGGTRRMNPPTNYIGSSRESNGTGTSFALDDITGSQPGDVLVCFLWLNSGSTVVTPPAGWTLIINTLLNTSAMQMISYWKTKKGAVRSDTWALDVSTAYSGHVHAFRRIDQITPIVDAAQETENASTSTTIVCPAITTTVKSVLIEAYAGTGNRGFKVYAPMFKRPRFLDPNGNPQDRISLGYTDPLPPGTYGSFSNTAEGASTVYGAQTISLAVI